MPVTSSNKVLKRAYRNWEKEPRIDAIEEDARGLWGRVTWGDLDVVTYPVKTLYMKCPQKVGHITRSKWLLTKFEKVISYYECELRRLRAEQICKEQVSQPWLHKSTSDMSTPETPSRPATWKAPAAIMYHKLEQPCFTTPGQKPSVGDKTAR